MLSSALAGVLRVGAVLLTAGGLGTGVYFLVPAGEGEDGASRLQAPEAIATVDGPGALSPPEEVNVPPPPPTPAFPPPITPSPIDTADWQTFTSPRGFTIKYPPDWILEPDDGYERLLNPLAAQQFDSARAQGLLDVDRVAGMAEFVIIIDNWNRFDPSAVIQTCESPDAHTGGPPGRAKVVTFTGRPAVLCERVTREPSGEETSGEGYSIEFPPGHTSGIGWRATAPASGDLATIAAIVRSFSFQTPP